MLKKHARITVFTSAYNRAHTLKRLYNSLINQTSKEFIWMIIDDGSIDDTATLVRNFVDNTSDFEIFYYQKKNEGMHSCWNVAALNCTTELMLNCDSDDWLVDNAIECILNKWDNENAKDKYAGLIGLMEFESRKIIGTYFPKVKSINVIDWSIGKYPSIKGAKSIVLRAELMRAVAPMQVFDGEINFNPMYMIRDACGERELLVMNQCISYVEYQQDGMSASMYEQYYNSPKSWCEYRKQLLGCQTAHCGRC